MKITLDLSKPPYRSRCPVCKKSIDWGHEEPVSVDSAGHGFIPHGNGDPVVLVYMSQEAGPVITCEVLHRGCKSRLVDGFDDDYARVFYFGYDS